MIAVSYTHLDVYKRQKQISEDDSATKVIKKNEATTTLEKEAFNVNKNQTSEIINDGNDYYLIYCVDNYMKDETAKNLSLIHI